MIDARAPGRRVRDLRSTTTSDLTTTERRQPLATESDETRSSDTTGATDAGDAAGARPQEPGHEAGHEGASTFRHSYTRDRATLVRRLRRIEGQVRGIERMIEREEYCVDILQQTAALKAAVESVSLLILEDHVQGCVRTAAEQGDADRYVEEVLDVVRRSLGRPLRSTRP